VNAILTRRRFIAASVSAAGGLVIAVSVRPAFAAAPSGALPTESRAAPGEVNAFVVVDPDNQVTLRIAKSEMGQGVMTSLAMIVAEELHCDFAKIKVEYASANRNLLDGGIYRRMSTGGSSSVRRSREFLQQAGASARERLIGAAAARWSVDRSACAARGGEVLHAASNRKATFGELAAHAATIILPREPAIKTPDQFTLIGTSQPRFDTPAKVTGAAKFGIDARLPDMVYAAVLNCPVFGGKLRSFDASAIKNRRGYIACAPVENGIAIVFDRFWRAKEAANALPVEWSVGADGNTDSAQFREEYRGLLDGKLTNVVDQGDAKAAFAGAARVVEALYEAPHLAHAPMEPLNATVHWRPDQIDVWMGTQDADGALKLAAQVGGVDPARVFIHNCYLGGGFGRRAVNDELRQAVQVSKAIGKPVKLVWTREQDIQHDRYRPQAAIAMKAALRPDGIPMALDFRTAVGSISRSLGWARGDGIEPSAVEGLANTPYRSEALKVDAVMKNTHVPVMFWRSVGSSQNAFAVESFIDELLCRGQGPVRLSPRAARRQAGFPRRARQARRQGRLGQAFAERLGARHGDP